MNKGARLATSELNEAYKDAQQDLAVALTDQAKQYAEAQAEINKTFNEATAEAEITRDNAIASLKADLAETITAIDKDLQESIADVNKNLQEALNEAFVAFQEAQAETRKELADTLAEIEKDMVEKLGSITNATKSTIEAIKALATALASAKTFTAPTVAIPSSPTPTNTPYTITEAMKKTGAASEGEYMRESRGLAITQNISYPTASASEISAQTLSAIKFGTSGGYTPSFKTVGSRDR
jgi:HD-GYP domain-containing protein (c-di-GMP phosphodiesterase class II)